MVLRVILPPAFDNGTNAVRVSSADAVVVAAALAGVVMLVLLSLLLLLSLLGEATMQKFADQNKWTCDKTGIVGHSRCCFVFFSA